MIPKKVELLIRFFEPFWISRVFHFSLGTFEEVEHLPGPHETSDETYAQSKFDISGSNETMQNAQCERRIFKEIYNQWAQYKTPRVIDCLEVI